MQINSTNNLPIIAGFNRPTRHNQQNTHQESNHTSSNDRAQRNQEPLEGQIVQSQFGAAGPGTQRVGPTVNAQPLFDQQLTQSGERARRAYQNTELAGDVELANRLDVIV